MKQITILLSPDHNDGLYIYIITLGTKSEVIASCPHNIGTVLSWLYGYSQKLNVTIEVRYDNGRLEHLATIYPVQVLRGNYAPYVEPPFPFDHKIMDSINKADEIIQRRVIK